jgi:hypothetical protein
MGRAMRDFFRDLGAGEPVPWIFVSVIALIFLLIMLWGVKIMRDKRRLDEERKDRWRKSGARKL